MVPDELAAVERFKFVGKLLFGDRVTERRIRPGPPAPFGRIDVRRRRPFGHVQTAGLAGFDLLHSALTPPDEELGVF